MRGRVDFLAQDLLSTGNGQFSDALTQYLLGTFNFLVDLGFGTSNNLVSFDFGSAFGWKIMSKEGLALITVFITIVLLWIFIKIAYIRGISLFLAGAWGNLLDRWRFGYVIDFIEPSFWATFNLADVFIVMGIILILLSLWFDEKRENSSL